MRRSSCIALILCAGAAFFSTETIGQADSRRAKNSNALLSAMESGASGGHESIMTARDRFLATLPKNEAAQAEVDFAAMAERAGLMVGSELSREHLRITKRYMSPGEPTYAALVDFWSYRVMIDTRAEKGEIKREEHEYLVTKKQAELASSLARIESEFDAEVRKAERERRAAQNASDAMAREIEWERERLIIDMMRRGISNTLQQRRVCRTVPYGAGFQTICN